MGAIVQAILSPSQYLKLLYSTDRWILRRASGKGACRVSALSR
jgi:hypothetical protein